MLRGPLSLISWPELTIGKSTLFYSVLLLAVTSGDIGLAGFAQWLGLLSVMLVFGYLINDWADRAEDLAAGKRNAFQKIPSFAGPPILVCLLAAAAAFGFRLCPDKRSASLLAAQLVTAAAYSMKPLRLKTRGFWGLAADVAGQFVLPMGLILQSLPFARASDWIFLQSLMLVHGFCLELGHQRSDRKNDLVSGTQTMGTGLSPGALTSAYRWLLLAQGPLFVVFPFYLMGRMLVTAAAGPQAWLLITPMMWVLSALVISTMRHLHRARTYLGEYDPYFASRGTATDRLYMEFPNLFMPVYLSATIVPLLTHDWRYVPLGFLWARLSFILCPNRLFVRRLLNFLWPPELSLSPTAQV